MQHSPETPRYIGPRTAYAALALLAGTLMVVLAWHYPLGSGAALLILLGLGAAMFWQPWLWLVLVPGLLPLIGWAPWSGWLIFEELDLLALTAAAAGYARLAYMPFGTHALIKHRVHATKVDVLSVLLVCAFGASVLIAIAHGIGDAGGFVWGWWQGYHEPMNSVRLGKSFFLALLLWPLWRSQSQQGLEIAGPGSKVAFLWSVGMCVGLAGVTLTTIWERMAFTGLLNFSADYRTTGMFWEMHVGGAALDGYLALTVPFALHQLLHARKPWHWVSAGVVLGLGLYACLTTFSRGVYLALPVGVAVLLWLNSRQQAQLAATQQGETGPSDSQSGVLRTGLSVVSLYAVAAAWVFHSSGYRGALALMGAVVALLATAHRVRGMRWANWATAAVLCLILCALMLVSYTLEGKASYVGFAVSFFACIGAPMVTHRRSALMSTLGLASFGGVLLGTGLVFRHWGGDAALMNGLPVLGLLLLIFVVFGLKSKLFWPDNLRWLVQVSGAMAMALTVVGVFSGGAYIEDRFGTGGEDLRIRLDHWKQGVSMLDDGAEFASGKGMGRYPGTFYIYGPQNERVGDYRLASNADGNYVVLSGGHRPLPPGDGALLRFSQRISPPVGKTILSADILAEKDVALTFEACPKHLLYTEYGCLESGINLKAQPGRWQHIDLPMKGPQLSRGDWFAPKLLVFAVAVLSKDGVAAIDNVHLRDATGAEILANSDFSQGLAHWFMSSDRNHLPWHIKSMPLNVLFDQGWVGIVLFLGLTALSLWRLVWGSAKNHPLAPAIAGAIIGFWIVGLFDSLLDAPRVAFLFYFLLFTALARPPLAPRMAPRKL